MRKIHLIAVIGSMAVAGPALAQSVDGDVTVTGNVTGLCAVIPVGGSPSSTFSGTIALGQLNDNDGTLSDSLIGSAVGSPAGSYETRVVCTDSNPEVELSATRLTETPDNVTPLSGFADTIDYSTRAAINTAAGGVVNFDYRTLDAATTGSLGGLIAAGNQNNVTITVFDLDTVGGNGNILVAGDYEGVISLSISPQS
jgi:hypothetical protein